MAEATFANHGKAAMTNFPHQGQPRGPRPDPFQWIVSITILNEVDDDFWQTLGNLLPIAAAIKLPFIWKGFVKVCGRHVLIAMATAYLRLAKIGNQQAVCNVVVVI